MLEGGLYEAACVRTRRERLRRLRLATDDVATRTSTGICAAVRSSHAVVSVNAYVVRLSCATTSDAWMHTRKVYTGYCIAAGHVPVTSTREEGCTSPPSSYAATPIPGNAVHYLLLWVGDAAPPSADAEALEEGRPSASIHTAGGREVSHREIVTSEGNRLLARDCTKKQRAIYLLSAPGAPYSGRN